MSEKKYLKLPIKGMHCRSCELLIEDQIKEIKQVTSVEVSQKLGEAIIGYEGEAPSYLEINNLICGSGYSIGREGRLSFFTQDPRDYKNIAVALLILADIYLALVYFDFASLNFQTELSNPSWSFVLMIGLVAGFSTCMALVGGLTLSLSARFVANHPQATLGQKFKPHIFFGLGRIISYAFFGGILGYAGSVFKISSTVNGILILLVGAVMFIMGLQLINLFPYLNSFKITLPKSLSRALGFKQKNEEYSNPGSFVLGALTFFLPCGFTQAMQLYAVSTGNFWSGFLILGLFAIGTAPGLLSVGGITSLVKGSFKEIFFKVAGLAVIFFGLFNLSNGYALADLNFKIGSFFQKDNTSKVISKAETTTKTKTQIVNMTETGRGYTPNRFTIKKGVPVRWVIEAKELYSCASSIAVPKLGIQKNLKLGENIIEFTPNQLGLISFSCSMGMYTGSFTVVEN